MLATFLALLVLSYHSIANRCVKAVVGFDRQSILLDCISDYDNKHIENGEWTFNNESVPRLNDAILLDYPRHTLFWDGSLQVQDLRDSDAGLYQCCSQDRLNYKIYWMVDAYNQSPGFFYNDSAIKLYCHFSVRVWRSRWKLEWYHSKPLQFDPTLLVNGTDFLTEEEEYACTEPVLSEAGAQCVKAWLTILRPPDNGVYRSGLFPAATPRATVTTIGLNQVRVSGAVWASTPAGHGSQIAKYVVVKLKHTTIPPSPSPEPYSRAARVSPLTLAAWNVRSLLDNPRGNRSERRTALVPRELACYKVDIAALSETRFSEQGQLEEVGAGFPFF
ncbi:unnamed protein product [Schistocephalus solidus]|uniref:Ig-like domain-containing protein n=1 Tax=Schistocephalus solidus TaxID=70667 RepID=A0A183STI4_SCHSO|nr:unnamed protein product [Schistocephalus solidus]